MPYNTPTPITAEECGPKPGFYRRYKIQRQLYPDQGLFGFLLLTIQRVWTKFKIRRNVIGRDPFAKGPLVYLDPKTATPRAYDDKGKLIDNTYAP